MNFFDWRIFWTCSLEEGSNGYYYHVFRHLFKRKGEWVHTIFAGYLKRTINKRSSSWRVVKERLK